MAPNHAARVAGAMAALLSTMAVAEVPNRLAHTGRLVKSDGLVGTVTMVFSIYDTGSGGVPLWSETQGVSLEDGYFSVRLGSVSPLPAALWNAGPRYLGVRVDADSEMTPREDLVSVPYALVANDAVGDLHPKSIAIGGKTIIDSGGEWVGPQVKGATGPQGAQGPAGTPGQSVAGFPEPAGANCATGGLKYVSASGTQYVCNGVQGPQGATGSSGPQGATGATGPAGSQGAAGQGVVGGSEPAGANCAAGGVKYSSSSGTSYVCNGVAGSVGPQGPIGPPGTQGPAGTAGATGPTGATGATGLQGAAGVSVVGSSEAPGSNCATGGAKYVSASGTSYVCNGAQGPSGATGAAGAAGPQGTTGQSAVGSPEAPGSNCAKGGVKYVSASGTNYVCNGEQGVAGAQGNVGPTGATGSPGQSVTGTAEPAGANCVAGGVKYVSASGTNYVCNGAISGNTSWTPTASNNLRVSADAEASSTSATYERKKEITIGGGLWAGAGTLRIVFDARTSSAGYEFLARIYRNGVAVGPEQTATSITFLTYSVDLSGWSAGDSIQLYLKAVSGVTVYCRNFRVFYDRTANVDHVVNLN